MKATRQLPREMPGLRWPETALPVIRIAGQFPLPYTQAELGCVSRDYRGGTVAIHQHDYEAQWRIHGQVIELQPGDITLTPAHTSNRYLLNRPGFHRCVHFDPRPLRGSTALLPLWVRPGPAGLAAAERLQTVIALYRNSQAKDGTANLAQKAAAASLQAFLLWLNWLAACLPRLQAKDIPQGAEIAVDSLRRALDDGYREKWPVARCVQTAGLSQNYLARIFHLKYGLTVQQYLFQRRIDYARHLLLTTGESIKQIAYQSRLGPPHYFARRFRATAGLTPSLYRSSLR